MKKYYTLFLILIGLNSSAQNANWGTGLAVIVSPNTTDIDISVFDPVLSTNVDDNLYTGNGMIYSNTDGVVVAYGSNSYMEFATYDWDLHVWKKESMYLGSLNATILTADGIVAGYGSNNYLSYAIYDVNLHTWKTGTQYLGSTNDTITIADGIVAGYGSNNYLESAIYDVQLQSWQTNSQYLGSTNAVIANADGVVAGYGSINYLVYGTYDIEQQLWKTGSSYLGSSNSSIATLDGIVAGYGSTNYLESAIYDFDLGQWNTNSTYLGNSGTFTINSGMISYSGSSTSGVSGYNSSAANWHSGPTTPKCKLLPYGVTNSSWVRMQCMSYGGGSFSYSSGDGHQIYRKAGWKKYNQNNSYNVELNVSNGTSNSACSALVDITSGIDEEKVNSFNIFPNPAYGELQIKFPAFETGEIRIINFYGQTVYAHTIKNENTIPLKLYDKGIYLIQFTGSGRTFTKKLEIVN